MAVRQDGDPVPCAPRTIHKLGWRVVLLGLIVGAEGSVVSARRRRQTVVKSSSLLSRVWTTENAISQRNLLWWNRDADHERQDVCCYDSTWLDPRRAPWRRPDGRGIALAALATSIPTKRFVLSGVAALYAAHTIQKLRASDPLRRSLYFWSHAGPIVVRRSESGVCLPNDIHLHLKRPALLSKAHYKFTRWWLTASKADRPKRDLVFESLHNRYSQPALGLVLHLRGLYVKMGQILSSRPDFMPTQYVQCFTELQDNIPACDTAVVQRMAVEALRNECAAYAKYEDLVLDPVALGSASIGQVHRAMLYRKDGGETKAKEVAVKVMHRGGKAKFLTDFQVFRWLCRVAIPSWRGLLDALEKQVMTEFDYLNEAAALNEVRNNMLHSPYRNRVCIPKPMEELCCEHVLVMEMLHGKKLIDSIRDRLTAAIGGSEAKATEFLAKRRHEVVTGEDAGSREVLCSSVGAFGKLKLLFLFGQCRRVIDLLVDVHGYQIFRTGESLY